MIKTMRENVGYTVIKSIKLPHCEFVLGEKENATVAKYVKLHGTPDIVKHTFKEVVRG